MKNNIVLIFILLFSLIIRLINLNQSLWLDEAINVVYARSNDFWWFISKYPMGDFHPAGWFSFLWIWGHLFGWSEISVRFPSVIFGVATVFFTYLIGKELSSKKVGTIAALMLAVAPLHIYYSQEARVYSLSAFAVTLSVYSFIRLLDKRKYSSLLFILASVVVLYSDYVAYFIFLIHILYILFWRKDLFRRYFSLMFIVFLFYIPWLLVLPSQLINGQKIASIIPGWKEVVGGSEIKELVLLGVKTTVGRVSFDNSLYYGAFISVIVLPLLAGLMNVKNILDRKTSLILCWLAITPLLVWLFSFIIPVFSYFRLLFVIPALYILISLSINNFKTGYFKIILVLIITTELVASGLYLFNENYHRENWRGASSWNYQSNVITLFEDDTVLAPYQYYNLRHVNAFTGLKNKPAKSINDVIEFQNKIQGKGNVILFDYLVEINDPHKYIEQKLVELGYKKIETTDYRGVGFIFLFSKDIN